MICPMCALVGSQSTETATQTRPRPGNDRDITVLEFGETTYTQVYGRRTRQPSEAAGI